MPHPPQADGARVLADLNALRAIGAYKTGVHKPTFSEPHAHSLEWLAGKLPAARDLTISELTGPAFTGFSNETLLFDAACTEGG